MDKYFILLIILFILQFIIAYITGFINKIRFSYKLRMCLSMLSPWIVLILIINNNLFNKINLFEILFVISSNLVFFVLWTLLVWGFAINILTSVPYSHKKFSIQKLLSIYSNKKGILKISNDRLMLLIKFKFVNLNKKKINITFMGRILLFFLIIFDKIYFIKND